MILRPVASFRKRDGGNHNRYSFAIRALTPAQSTALIKT
jgi:hypothetical protein